MPHDTYCIMTATKHAFSAKIDITIDLGQQNVSTEYADTLKECTSEVDALNYMSAQGWELVNSYVNPSLMQARHVMRKKA
jgi:hypothetical protein